METTITAESPIATFDKVVLVERIQFIRQAESAARVKIMHNGYLHSEYTGSITVDCERPGRHPDLLPRFSGEYQAVGMLEGDRLVITYRLAPQAEPIPLSERDIERLQKEWDRERLQKESQRFANLRSWN
jgi:hypothetical protein